MARLRRKDRGVEETPEPEQVEVVGLRASGPWDVAERAGDGESAYVDLGALRVRGRVGFDIQLPAEDNGDIGAVVLITEDAALELRAFAATRSGGVWDDVRTDIVTEVERLGGTCVEVEGPFGPELRVSVTVELEDGTEGFQPSRIIGIEGPRWLLRATFLGDAGLNPSDEGLLMDALHDVVVVRGSEPRIPREPLLLTLPGGDVVVDDQA